MISSNVTICYATVIILLTIFLLTINVLIDFSHYKVYIRTHKFLGCCRFI
jgi:hypothetical protein